MQSETVVILVTGVCILTAGSLSLWIARNTSPGLQGLGSLSLAFLMGALGAGMLLASWSPVLYVLLADLALLSSFLLLHRAVLRLVSRRQSVYWPALGILGAQALVDLLCLLGLAKGSLRVETIGLLVALQAGLTARELWLLARNRLAAPALYCAVLLLSFGAFNLLRSALVFSHRLTHSQFRHVNLFTFALYIATAIGLAFGFFWATTASLTAEVEQVASTDPLTRVANRRVFLRWCERELLRSQRAGVPFSLVMIDLDHFKQVNDHFGHQRGDEVLVSVVERMQDSIRGIDVLCRWGGEEFAVLLPNAPQDATSIVAERIRVNILRMGVDLGSQGRDGDRAILTASLGAATYQGEHDTIADMLLRADRALYRAKGTGRNRVLIAG